MYSFLLTKHIRPSAWILDALYILFQLLFSLTDVTLHSIIEVNGEYQSIICLTCWSSKFKPYKCIPIIVCRDSWDAQVEIECPTSPTKSMHVEAEGAVNGNGFVKLMSQ
ncbi:hypothetical protein Ddye_009723 [Dipteronia dyeriana]|uniref:Uncharacterized protein n=1 Tax=Dipteronia dyeriana TaxID=168575 RepID=A0AAD9XBW9_9ROSI|nr:hypothetical protein Ddye_009723 [Dipteronia dyeriana]